LGVEHSDVVVSRADRIEQACELEPRFRHQPDARRLVSRMLEEAVTQGRVYSKTRALAGMKHVEDEVVVGGVNPDCRRVVEPGFPVLSWILVSARSDFGWLVRR